MIEWITVLSLILFGLILIVVEILFVPGTTLVGVLGFLFLLFGIGYSYSYFGSETGWITLGATGVASGLILYFAFKANVWGRFALKTSINSKVNEGEVDLLVVGEEGIAISALRPVGKAELGKRLYEVKTNGEYVDSGSRVRITKIFMNQIIVEPIN
jgi:membrane-bound ClpP family serine protease